MGTGADTVATGRQGRALAFWALVIAAVGWSVTAYDFVTGRGPGSGDIAGGLENLDDLMVLALLGASGVIAAILAFVARRRAPESVFVTAVQSVSIGTVAMSIVFIAQSFLA